MRQREDVMWIYDGNAQREGVLYLESIDRLLGYVKQALGSWRWACRVHKHFTRSSSWGLKSASSKNNTNAGSGRLYVNSSSADLTVVIMSRTLGQLMF